MDRIERLLANVLNDQFLLDHSDGFNANHAARRDALRRQIVREWGEMVEALKELTDLMDNVVSGEYTPDSFTTQPARAVLARTKGES